jgi:hypothetical protein
LLRQSFHALRNGKLVPVDVKRPLGVRPVLFRELFILAYGFLNALARSAQGKTFPVQSPVVVFAPGAAGSCEQTVEKALDLIILIIREMIWAHCLPPQEGTAEFDFCESICSFDQESGATESAFLPVGSSVQG